MSEEGPDGRQDEIRLTPPPRVEPVGSKLRRRRPVPAPSRRLGPAIVPPIRRGRPRWVGPAAFGLLALVGALTIYLTRAGSSPAPTPPTATLTPSTPATDVGEGLAPSRLAPSPAPTPRARLAAPNLGTAFGRAMADGLAAIDAGDFETAREAFARAAAIDPDSPEPAAGLERLDAAASRMAIEELRDRGAGLLAAEAWREAAADYRKALAIDPTLTFARAGLEAAETRAALSDRLAYHLERPERLTAEEVLGEVDRLLETAREVGPAGPRHAAQVAALEELAGRVRQPVRVSLVSDDRTAVTVYQFGSLGTFARREIELRPGTYTVVGSRAGYRDVRRQLKIEPGRTPEPFEIRCEEKI